MAGVETLIRDLRLRRGPRAARARARRGRPPGGGGSRRRRRRATRRRLAGAGRYSSGRGAQNRARGRGRAARRGDARALAELADTEHPQGVIAVIEPPRWTLDDLTRAAGEVVVVLDAVQDPGNVGAIAPDRARARRLGDSSPSRARRSSPTRRCCAESMGALFRLAVDLEHRRRMPRLAGAGRARRCGSPTAARRAARPPAPDRPPLALVVGQRRRRGAARAEAVAARRLVAFRSLRGRVAERGGRGRHPPLRGAA